MDAEIPKVNININSPEDYYNNLTIYLTACLMVLCDDINVPVPPLIIKYNKPKGFYESTVDTDIIYIDIKADDYVGALLHEFGHYIGLDEWGAIDFVNLNRKRFQTMFNTNIMT